MILYHVTPARNVASIRKEGINPDYSAGKRKVIWYVGVEQLMWAISHVSSRHHVTVNQVVVYRVRLDDRTLKRTSWQHVYNVDYPVMTGAPLNARVYVEAHKDNMQVDMGFESGTSDQI